MTRKSGKHFHTTYGTLDSCFGLIRSHQQGIPWSPLVEIEPATRSASCGCWFDLLWWRSRYALLMRPNKVETAVWCSICRMEVLARFFSHGNSINIIQFLYLNIKYNNHPYNIKFYYNWYHNCLYDIKL